MHRIPMDAEDPNLFCQVASTICRHPFILYPFYSTFYSMTQSVKWLLERKVISQQDIFPLTVKNRDGRGVNLLT